MDDIKGCYFCVQRTVFSADLSMTNIQVNNDYSFVDPLRSKLMLACKHFRWQIFNTYLTFDTLQTFPNRMRHISDRFIHLTDFWEFSDTILQLTVFWQFQATFLIDLWNFRDLHCLSVPHFHRWVFAQQANFVLINYWIALNLLLLTNFYCQQQQRARSTSACTCQSNFWAQSSLHLQCSALLCAHSSLHTNRV